MNRTTCLLLIAVAASCGRAGKGKTIEIALVTKALDSEWWQRVKSGAEEAARATPGVHLVVLAPERKVNIDQQAGILEDQITRGVSVLAVAPAGVSEILPVLDKAKAAGIPVLIVDTDVNWPAKLSYIGADNRLGGQGKVAVIRGILGIATHAVVAGRLSGDMAGLPEVMGRRAVEEAIKAAKGQHVDEQVIITPVLVTKENASPFLQ